MTNSGTATVVRSAMENRVQPVSTHGSKGLLPQDWSMRSSVLLFAVATVVYFLLGRLALSAISSEGVAVFWPGSGLAAGALAILGTRARGPILLAVFTATVLANLLARSSIPATLVFASCNTIECLLFWLCLRALDGVGPYLERLKSVAAFLASALIATAVAALPAAVAIHVLGLSDAQLYRIWSTWFLSDFFGILTLTPILLTLPAIVSQPPSRAALLEAGLALITVAGVAYYAFAYAFSGVLALTAPSTILLPFFIWIAARFPPFFSAVASMLLATIIVIIGLAADTAFGSPTLSFAERLATGKVALLTTSLVLLTLSAVFARTSAAVNALQSSDQRLKLALAARQIYAFEHDAVSGAVVREGGLAKRLGLPETGDVAEYVDRLPAVDRAEFEKLLRQASPAEPDLETLLNLKSATGETLRLEYRARAEFDDNGSIIRLRGTFHDVTERMESDERARELQYVLNAGRMLTFEHDLVSGVSRRSENAAEIFGISPAAVQMPREQFIKFVHPDDRHKLAGSGDRISPQRPFNEVSYRFLRPDGSIAWLEVLATGSFDDEGRVTKIRGATRDVTERELARARLEQREEQLRSALQAGRVFAFEFDEARRTVQRSDNAAEILGVPLEVARGSRNLIFQNVHPDDRDALNEYAKRAPNEDNFRLGTFRFIRPDGGTIWLEVSSNATFDAAGKLLHIRGLARDVTEKARADQRQAVLIKELDHRVKNALALMNSVIDRSRDRHQTLDDYVAVIKGRINSMARTQERLSRSKWTGVDIKELVADELAAYRSDDNCRIEGPGQLLEPGVAEAFAFTLHELATNAAKYGALSKATGKVDVEWRVDVSEGIGRVLHLRWRETVDGGIRQPDRESYGLSTIRNSLAYEHDATVTVDFTQTGLHCTIDLPLPDASASVDLGAGGVRVPAGSSAG